MHAAWLGAGLATGLLVLGCGDDGAASSGGAGQGGATSSSESASSSGGGEAGGGEGGAAPDACDPRNLEEGAPIAASCGVFVDPGGSPIDANGSQTLPYVTVGDALEDPRSASRPIYVCSSLDEGVTIAASHTLHGGIACDGWTVKLEETSWTAPANTPPVLITGETTEVTMVGFSIEPRDGEGFDAETLAGHSSIGVVVVDATVHLDDVEIFAGAGATGGAGATLADRAAGGSNMPEAFDGNDGGACGVPNNGAPAVAFTCPDGVETRSGRGGDGAIMAGQGGNAGGPQLGAPEPNGSGGAGDDGSVDWSCQSDAGHGENGASGAAGDPGVGGTALGAPLSTEPFLPGGAGTDGALGGTAQGGGGGGGVRGGVENGCSAGQSGPSGASGGAGGCGGAGGQGGGAGGSSVALLLISGATATFGDVLLGAAEGGLGGTGGDGQLGGTGGDGGDAVFACNGGRGGTGGRGGPGGGGRGGHSIGIAYQGVNPPMLDPGAISVAENAAPGGPGGHEDAEGNTGGPGVLAEIQAL